PAIWACACTSERSGDWLPAAAGVYDGAGQSAGFIVLPCRPAVYPTKQENRNMGVLVGKSAPDFKCQAVYGNGEIKDYVRSEAMQGKYGLLFFWPLDFTFVCPSELIAVDHRMAQFQALGVEVVGVSIDSHF